MKYCVFWNLGDELLLLHNKNPCSILALYLCWWVVLSGRPSQAFDCMPEPPCHQVPWQPLPFALLSTGHITGGQPLSCSEAMPESWVRMWWSCNFKVVVPSRSVLFRCLHELHIVFHVLQRGFPRAAVPVLISHINPQLIEKPWISLLHMWGTVTGEEVCFEMLENIVGETRSLLWPHYFGRNRRSVLLQIIIQTKKER